jgi:hypothetical protein
VNQFTTKFKSVFDSHYQMHIRLTHNRSRGFHISVETTFSYQCGNKCIIRAHFSNSSMVSFGNPLRIFRFPPSLIQPVLYIVHVHRHQWYLGLLDWIVCSCPGRYSLLQNLLMFGEGYPGIPVRVSVVFPESDLRVYASGLTA